jgi:hypothetical protein
MTHNEIDKVKRRFPLFPQISYDIEDSPKSSKGFRLFSLFGNRKGLWVSGVKYRIVTISSSVRIRRNGMWYLVQCRNRLTIKNDGTEINQMMDFYQLFTMNVYKVICLYKVREEDVVDTDQTDEVTRISKFY